MFNSSTRDRINCSNCGAVSPIVERHSRRRRYSSTAVPQLVLRCRNWYCGAATRTAVPSFKTLSSHIKQHLLCRSLGQRSIHSGKCKGILYPGRGKGVKIPLLPENAGKRSLNYLLTLETIEGVTTCIKELKWRFIKNIYFTFSGATKPLPKRSPCVQFVQRSSLSRVLTQRTSETW